MLSSLLLPGPFKKTMVEPQLEGPGSCLKDRTRGCLFKTDSTVRRKTPLPFPWIILTSNIPFREQTLMYSSTTSEASFGAKVWRSITPSIGICTGELYILSQIITIKGSGLFNNTRFAHFPFARKHYDVHIPSFWLNSDQGV